MGFLFYLQLVAEAGVPHLQVDDGDHDLGAILGPHVPGARETGRGVDEAGVVGGGDCWGKQCLTLIVLVN